MNDQSSQTSKNSINKQYLLYLSLEAYTIESLKTIDKNRIFYQTENNEYKQKISRKVEEHFG